MKRFGQILAFVSYLVVVLKVPVMSKNPDFKGELTGIVKDSISGEGLPYASLQFFSVPDNEMVQGTVTDGNGNFKVSKIDRGEYKIVTSYMGYQDKKIFVSVFLEKEFFEILLAANTISLAAINIAGERKLLEGTVEKTIVNVSKNTTLSAGTALDALKTAPSVDIDFDGNIRYRGSEQVMVLVNGEKSGLVKMLSQIPSNAVEKIEIIGNPSAKYEAEGMSGIINVVLKSGQGKSNNTTLALNFGDCNLYGGTIGYTRNINDIQFFVNAGGSHKNENQVKKHYRGNYGNPVAPDYSQYDKQYGRLNNGFINASLNYKVNEKNDIGVSAVWSKAINPADRFINYKTIAKNGAVEQESDKAIGISLDNHAFDGDISYKLNFGKDGQQIKIFAGYSEFSQYQDMENRHFYGLSPELQNTRTSQLNKEGQGTLDYIYPLNKSVIFNGGYSHISQDILNHFTSESYDYASFSWKPDTGLENKFRYIQHINALFLETNVKKNLWESRIGLRTEHTQTSQNSEKEQSYLSFFPSFRFSGKMKENHTFYVTYNRRVNRPAIKMLNPFTDEYADELNTHKGNPALKPEFVNSFELGDRFSGKKWSGSAALYYRHIGQAISRVKIATNDSALVVTYMNLNNASLTGFDLISAFQPFKWWKITASANIFHTSLAGQSGKNIINGEKFAWEGNLNSLFRLPKGYTITLVAYYRSKLPSILGIYKERYYTNWAFSKKIMKGKGQFVFSILDVFDTHLFGLDLDALDDKGLGYSQSNRRKINSECFTLNFTYNLNGKSQSGKKGKENFFLDSFEK